MTSAHSQVLELAERAHDEDGAESELPAHYCGRCMGWSTSEIGDAWSAGARVHQRGGSCCATAEIPGSVGS